MGAIHNGCKYLCVLDLKQAYASVPRGDLMRRLEGIFDGNLSAMVEAMLQRTVVETIGDETKLRREMTRGLPEGLPLSPSLFNLFIDPLAEGVTRANDGSGSNPLNLFADDILLLAPTPAVMQRLLDECASWARANGLTWGIQKCHALAAVGSAELPFLLAGEELRYSSIAEILGVQLAADGITEAATLELLRTAELRLQQIQAAGIRRPQVGSLRLRMIYAALIRPVWSYALHLTPMTDRVTRAAAQLIDKVTAWTYPKLQRHSRMRARRLFGLLDADVLRHQQLKAMAARMVEARVESAQLGSLENQATKKDEKMAHLLVEAAAWPRKAEEEQLGRWERIEEAKRRRRKVALGVDLQPHALWALPTGRHASCAANWLFGRYPKSKSAVKWFVGASAYATLDKTLRETFLKPVWDTSYLARVTQVLEYFSDYWPMPLRSRRLTNAVVEGGG